MSKIKLYNVCILIIAFFQIFFSITSVAQHQEPDTALVPAHYLTFIAYATFAQAAKQLPSNFSISQFQEALINTHHISLPDEDIQFNDHEAQFALKARVIKGGEVLDLERSSKIISPQI